ncbi:MAG: trehalose-phosphatase [Alphaproteobacteria bacterium]|nr:trehalose-phosphatase [Alphaproteobacteria bacterium]
MAGDGPEVVGFDAGWALFLDVDGTLLDIAERPQAVVVPAPLRRDLARVAARLDGALALVSGRPIAELDRLFAPLRLPTAGTHGAEIRFSEAGPVVAAQIDAAFRALGPAVARIAEAWPEVEIEDKGTAIAVHFRRSPDAEEPISRALATLVEGSTGGLELLEGKMVRELRDRRHTKGAAVGSFLAVRPFTGRRPVFIGDDVTDMDGFRAVEALGGLAFPVGFHPRLGRRPAFAAPEQVREWLARVARDATEDE